MTTTAVKRPANARRITLRVLAGPASLDLVVAGQSFLHAAPALVMWMIPFCILHPDGRINIAPNV